MELEQNNQINPSEDDEPETPSQVETLPIRTKKFKERPEQLKSQTIKTSKVSDEYEMEENNFEENEEEKSDEIDGNSQEDNLENIIENNNNIQRAKNKIITNTINIKMNNINENENENNNNNINNNINDRTNSSFTNYPQKNALLLKRLEIFENMMEKMWKEIRNLKQEIISQEDSQMNQNQIHTESRFLCIKREKSEENGYESNKEEDEDEFNNNYKFTKDIYKK